MLRHVTAPPSVGSLTLLFSDTESFTIGAEDAITLAEALWRVDKTPVPGAVSLAVELKVSARTPMPRPVRIEPRELHHLCAAAELVAARGGESDSLKALRAFLAPISDAPD